MKKISKRFLVVLCTLLMSLSISGCGKEKEIISFDESKIPTIAEQVLESLGSLKPETLKLYENQLPEDDYAMWSAAVESYTTAVSEIGEVSLVDANATADDKTVTVLINVKGETEKTAQIEVLLNKKMTPTSITTNVNRTFEENMSNAGLNTLLGMGTVFIVLIFICFVISAFKFIAVLEQKLKEPKVKQQTASASVDNAVQQIIKQEELTDDLELVAVISAAIAAFEEANGGSGDGYVVRSIKRRA